jgi:hypothetical protein
MKPANNKNSLEHGQFKVTTKTSNNDVIEHVVNHHSQEELANRWQLIIPNRTKKSTIHHFSVYLSQLPHYLWKHIHISWTNNEQYDTINYGIYQYSVKMSKYDCDIQKLYKLVMKQNLDKNQLNQLTQLHDHLEKQRVKGWIMICAKNALL